MLAPTIAVDPTVRPPLRIGDWRVDPATNTLCRDGRTVRLEPKAMEVLMMLADRAGQVVSREALFASAWPGVVVGDEALTQSVIKLRRALRDDPRAPSYIETIAKRGYRLIAPVGPAEAAPVAAGTTMPRPSQPMIRSRRLRRAHAVAASVALAIVVAGAAYVARMTPSPDAGSGEATLDRRLDAPTLAVAPFESLGPDPGQGYLARGIGNDLAIELARLPGVRVVRLASDDPRGAARQARYVVSGSVQRVAETLRISVHLVETETGQQLWSERFERPFGDLFAVQDAMIRQLAGVLPGKLDDAARMRLAKRHTRSLEAYDHFLRAQARFLARQPDANDDARELYRKALDLDPKFARAYAGLAMTYAMDGVLRPARDAAPALQRALELAEAARLIDPDLAEVHWALGFVHAQARRHEEAIRSLRRAIELDGSFADAYAFMGGILTYVGRPSESIPLLRTAMRLNPDGGSLYFLVLGRAYLFENDAEQALINLREADRRNPVNVETRVYLTATFAALGRRADAAWEAQEILALDPAFTVREWLDAYPLQSPRLRERLTALLAAAGL